MVEGLDLVESDHPGRRGDEPPPSGDGRLRALTKIAAALLEPPRDGPILQQLAERIGSALGTTCIVWVGDPAGAGRVGLPPHATGSGAHGPSAPPEHVQPRTPPDMAGPVPCELEGPQLVSDAGALRALGLRLDDALVHEIGLAGAVAAPLRAKGSVVGALVVAGRSRSAPRSAFVTDLDFVELVARHVELALETALLEALIVQSSAGDGRGVFVPAPEPGDDEPPRPAVAPSWGDRSSERLAVRGDLERQLADVTALREIDRHTVSMALHENTLQTLLAVSWDLADLAEHPDDLAAIDRGRKLVDEAIDSLRAVSDSLLPPTLTSAGLGPALVEAITTFGEETGTEVDVDVDDVVRFDPVLEAIAFRVVELRLRTLGSAPPSSVTVVGAGREGRLHLAVETPISEVADRSLQPTAPQPVVAPQEVRRQSAPETTLRALSFVLERMGGHLVLEGPHLEIELPTELGADR